MSNGNTCNSPVNQNVELALYLSEVDQLQRLEDVLATVDVSSDNPLPQQILFFSTPHGGEYLGHVTSLNRLYQCFGRKPPLRRLYFGQEFCQYLIPELEELRRAYYFTRQLGWSLTYLTPGAITDDALEKVQHHLEFLAHEAPDTEVVVNSWGMLRMMSENFPQLPVVLGRLLNKQKRIPRDIKAAPPVNMDGIQTDQQTIMENQRTGLRGLSASIPSFRRHLCDKGVRRLEMDIVTQGVNIPEDRWGFGVSCYYPWTYVTSGRNCLTAAEADSEREFRVPEDACPRPCRQINASTILGSVDNPLIERGNTVFLFNDSFAQPYLTGDVPVDRVVYAPYAPL